MEKRCLDTQSFLLLLSINYSHKNRLCGEKDHLSMWWICCTSSVCGTWGRLFCNPDMVSCLSPLCMVNSAQIWLLKPVAKLKQVFEVQVWTWNVNLVLTSVRDLKLELCFRDGAKAFRSFSYDVHRFEFYADFYRVFSLRITLPWAT